MEFTFKDAEELCSLVSSQQSLVDKKRRWLESMILNPDGCTRRVKRPKFLNDVYLRESYIRSEEISCEKARASIEKSLSSDCNGYTHHVVQEGLQIFDFQKKENEPLDPEYVGVMLGAISKLTYEALQSVACIISHNKFSFNKTRTVMENIVKSHLPTYLVRLDQKDILCQLFDIFKNPCSYRSGSVMLVTPISPQLLSVIHHLLDELDGMPMQALAAMNRKIIEKSYAPKFGLTARSSNRAHVIKMVRKRCNKILTELEEGNYLPKKLSKALSVLNLYQKQKLRSMDISQSEFFPFTKETISLQNNILNALWSLPKLKCDKLKLLRAILDHDSKVEKTHFKAALRNYLIECLFECDDGDLPKEALWAIAFINQISGRHQVVLTDERKEGEVDAVLNLSSHLKALAHCCVDECSCGEELISLGNDSGNEDNDFILSGTNYFDLSSCHLQMNEPSSNNLSGTDVIECCWSETVGDTHNVSRIEDSGSKSEVHKKPCERTEDSGGTGHYSDNDVIGSGTEPCAEKYVDVNHLKRPRCSEIGGICDETSIVAHSIIGQILDKWLLVENNEVDKPARCHLGEGLVSQDPQENDRRPANSAENLEGGIFIEAVERLLPNLPKSCIDKVKRLLS
ncbi:hypothetical protein U9M48_022845 [Paspalum notatum var. saurae]|uniref:Uncharacterized protein n=1 Tax=Paspalum notatum var. saurae TaxID=547442 RepID=A0AAQ3TN63_PASNO